MPTGSTRTLAVLTTIALAAGGAVTLAGGASAAPGGELVYGLTTDNRLVSFRSATPGTILSDRAITGTAGLPLGTDLVGLDVRPRTGELLALGINEQLYVVDPATGTATAKGAPITPALSGTRFDIDVNPVADKVRIVSDADQNLRVDPDAGGASLGAGAGGADGALRYNDGDRFAGSDAQVAAAAYTNSVAGATSTTQFDIDVNLNDLVQQESNSGVLTTRGPLDVGDVLDAGLDVSASTDTTYALLQTRVPVTGGTTRTVYGFYTVDRTTGRATSVGEVGPAATATTPALAVEDIAVASSRFVVGPTSVTEGQTATVTVNRTGDTADVQSVDYAVTDGPTGSAVEDAAPARGTLTFGVGETSRTFAVSTLQDDFTEGTEALTVALSGATGGAVAGSGTLTVRDDEPGNAVGLVGGTGLVTFSVNTPGTSSGVRPVVGLPSGVTLVGIDVRPSTGQLYGVGSDSRVYRLDPATGVAVQGGALGVPLDGTSFGVDFNPVADRLRIVSDREQNLRVDVDDPGRAGTGTVQDGTLRYAAGDPNVGVNPAVAGAAYTNSFDSGPSRTATPTATTQYDVDVATGSLLRQDSNPGLLSTTGALGLPAGSTVAPAGAVGLDVAAAGNAAFATFGTSADATRRLYRVDLATGRATSLGALATPSTVSGPQTVDDLALTDTGRATFTPPASPTPSPSASATPSASPTASPSGSPTGSPTASPSSTPVGQLEITVDPAVLVPTRVSRVTVTGRPGSVIELQAYSRPTTEYGVVRRGTIPASGRLQFDVTPGTNTRLFAQVTGFPSTASRSVVIGVRTALSLTVVRNGTRDYTFKGRLLPRRADQLITLYRVLDDGSRVITNQIKSDDTGTYTIRRRFTGSGTFGFLTRTGQNLTNLAGESNTPETEAGIAAGQGRPRPTAIY